MLACHQHTEAADFVGALRPYRARNRGAGGGDDDRPDAASTGAAEEDGLPGLPAAAQADEDMLAAAREFRDKLPRASSGPFGARLATLLPPCPPLVAQDAVHEVAVHADQESSMEVDTAVESPVDATESTATLAAQFVRRAWTIVMEEQARSQSDVRARVDTGVASGATAVPAGAGSSARMPPKKRKRKQRSSKPEATSDDVGVATAAVDGLELEHGSSLEPSAPPARGDVCDQTELKALEVLHERVSALAASLETQAQQAQRASAAALASSAETDTAPLFEWCDGPLVRAMRNGEMLLLDEISLADDAVLERLNSVLEPGRAITLVERGDTGGADGDVETIVGADQFAVVATMNPGGDFGKRELSPALRSRFTEIWVPPSVDERGDMALIIDAALVGGGGVDSKAAAGTSGVAGSTSSTSLLARLQALRDPMLDFVEWCAAQAEATGLTGGDGGAAVSALSTRDVIAWARFVAYMVSGSASATDAAEATSAAVAGAGGAGALGERPWEALAHGAALVVMDGLALNASSDAADAPRAHAALRARAEAALLSCVPTGVPRIQVSDALDELRGARELARALVATATAQTAANERTAGGQARPEADDDADADTEMVSGSAHSSARRFGAPPFWIARGPSPLVHEDNFSVHAPTSAINLRRMLRALQLPKPVLLEVRSCGRLFRFGACRMKLPVA